MKEDPIESALDNKFLVAFYLAVVERVYGLSGLKAAKKLIADIRLNGNKALYQKCNEKSDRSSKTSSPEKPIDVQELLQSDVVVACIEFGLVSESDFSNDGVPCHIRCAAKSADCHDACDNLPLWDMRLFCKLSCTLEFIACLARC